MHSYSHILQKCAEIIAQSKWDDLLHESWNNMEFYIYKENNSQETAVEDMQNRPILHLYPNLVNLAEPHVQVLTAFGNYLFNTLPAEGTLIWKNKLCLPESKDIQTAKNKLESSELRKTCKTYKDVLDTYPNSGSSVSRLVFINIANALLINKVPYNDSIGIDIRTWGHTSEYCQRRKPHCLIPLVTAYAPSIIHKNFGSALACALTDKLDCVRDSSVAKALTLIIKGTLQKSLA